MDERKRWMHRKNAEKKSGWQMRGKRERWKERSSGLKVDE